MSDKHEAGKGDRYRKVDYAQWSRNWDAIFKKRKSKIKKLHPRKSKDIINTISNFTRLHQIVR